MDKSEQIARAGFNGHKGIVVCDAGAHILTSRRTCDTFDCSQVALHFLERCPNVDFVLILALTSVSTSTIRQRVTPQLFAHEIQPWMHGILETFNKAISIMPQPRQSAENANREREFWKGRESQQTHLGGMKMLGGQHGISELRMSTRTLLDLLSGRLSYERFQQAYSGHGESNPFERILCNGSMLVQANVERLEEEDHDEIVLRFGPPDAAAGKFMMPRQASDVPQE